MYIAKMRKKTNASRFTPTICIYVSVLRFSSKTSRNLLQVPMCINIKECENLKKKFGMAV